jgi:hypothetical protein
MGMYTAMPFDEYLATEAVSASGLRVFARSPWHYKNRLQITPTRPMLRGTLAHCALLEPDAMASRFAVLPEDAPRRPTDAQWNAAKSSPTSQAAKDWWREWQAQADGREIITADEWALCQAQLNAIKAVPELASLLASGRGEVSIFWIDPDTRLYCKARLDWLQVEGKKARVLELKSTADESPSGFGRTAARMKYELQRAHYIDAIKYGARLQFDSWTFAAVTSAAPVLAVPYDLTDEMASQADDERSEHMQRLAWCMETGTWPAYGDGKQPLDFPAYAKRSSEVEVAFIDTTAE